MLPAPPALIIPAPAAPDWSELQARGARIGAIRIDVQDVFDLKDAKENNFIGRCGNGLHISTHEQTIRQALLFHPGDRINLRRIRETERYLRTQAFIKDARIEPELLADGSVRAHVWVRDAWTMKFAINYNLLGGQHTEGASLQDQNFLGTGKTVMFDYARTPLRSSSTLTYLDPKLFGSDWTLQTDYSMNSDGQAKDFILQRPFLSLDTPWSTTVQVSTVTAALTILDQGARIYGAPSRLEKDLLGWAWAAEHGEGSAWRPGLALVNNTASYGPLTVFTAPGGLPAPDLAQRRLRGPAVTLSYLQDRFQVFRDMAFMDTPEDQNLGWAGATEWGSYLTGLGSTEPALFTQTQISKGWSDGKRDLLLAQASLSGRRGPDGWQDSLANLTFTGYWQQTSHLISAGRLTLDAAHRPDPEDIYYLGALEGLRGYPNYLHPGDARWVCSLDQRLLTDTRILGIIRLGFVAFADAGAIHRMDGTGWSRTYEDVGGGLRVCDLKSSLGHVIYFTVGMPLEREPGLARWTLAFGNIITF